MSEESYNNCYVPGYKHDVFISYAHIDNEPAPSVDEGWVSIFVKALKTRLRQKLGSKFISVWCDPRLPGSGEIKPAILDTVKDSATFVIILSPSYITSKWCNSEKDTFLENVKERNTFTRIFIVERDKLEEKPEEFQNLISHQFWVEEQEGEAPRILGDPKADPNNSKDLLYYQRLNNFAFKLSKELINLKSLTKGNPPINLKYDASPAVFLAEEVTNDPENLRENVRQYLDQERIRVLPEETSLYPSYLEDAASVEQRLIKELENCQVFVQLLRDLPGNHPSWQLSFPRFQYEIARKLSKPILQWRDSSLDLNTVKDNDQRILLENASTMKLEYFKSEIVTHLKSKEKIKPPIPGNKSIFINVEKKDRSLGDEISVVLSEQKVTCFLPILNPDLLDFHKDWEESLTTCNGLITVYGAVNITWVRAQLREYSKVISKRNQPLEVQAIYDGPPEEKEPLNVTLPPDVMIMDCRKGLNENELQRFLNALGVQP